jgi:hypothetical protein
MDSTLSLTQSIVDSSSLLDFSSMTTCRSHCSFGAEHDVTNLKKRFVDVDGLESLNTTRLYFSSVPAVS